MEKVAGHPRLFRRGATYYHRAAIPADIKDTYPKTEETFSLGTRDYQEALRKVRVAAVEVDERFEEHRRSLSPAAEPPVQEELTEDQIEWLGYIYSRYLLAEDEAIRSTELVDRPKGTIAFPPSATPEEINQVIQEALEQPRSFDEHVDDGFYIIKAVLADNARGRIGNNYYDEARNILEWDEVPFRIEPNSDSLRALAKRLQEAFIFTFGYINARNQGFVIHTPDPIDYQSWVSDDDEPQFQPNAPAQPQTQTSSRATSLAGPLLSEVVPGWMEEKSATSWTEKTEREHRIWMEHFIAAVGDRPLGEYGKSDARAFKNILLKLPANWNKYKVLQGLSVKKAAAEAQRQGLSPMAIKTTNKILGFVGSFWRWAENNYDEAPSDPFRGIAVQTTTRAKEERDPFSVEELNVIFSAPVYTGCNSLRFWKDPGEVILRDAGIFWVPLISLFSGARSGEIIQLYVDDIRQDNEVYFFDINEDGTDKRLKNASSKRVIPIHESLVRIGLLDHVEEQRHQGQQRLFPDLAQGADGYYSSPFSKHFNRFLTELKIKRPELTFHSFRHTFEDGCRNSAIPLEITNALQGHSQQGMAGRYGSGYSLQVLADAIGQLRYEGLNLEHLYNLS